MLYILAFAICGRCSTKANVQKCLYSIFWMESVAAENEIHFCIDKDEQKSAAKQY